METEVKLDEIKTEELVKMKAVELKELCKTEGLSCNGNKKELLERLQTKKFGRSDRFVGNLTKCRYCGSPVRVFSTSRQVIENGVLLIRGIRCSGKHRHTYQLKELIRPEKSQ